jgi:hypothetical protein
VDRPHIHFEVYASLADATGGYVAALTIGV